MSKVILEAMAYHSSQNSNYANSDVRKWLNGEFYNKAFTTESKKYIETTMVDNSVKSTACRENAIAQMNRVVCINTNDKVFLLSNEEVLKKYYLTDSDKLKKPTEYTKTKRIWEFDGYGRWWLRSPFLFSRFASVIDDGGKLNYNYLNDTRIGIVPALLIRLY